MPGAEDRVSVGSSTKKMMYLEPDETGVGKGKNTMASCAIERVSILFPVQWGATKETYENNMIGLFFKSSP